MSDVDVGRLVWLETRLDGLNNGAKDAGRRERARVGEVIGRRTRESLGDQLDNLCRILGYSEE